MEEKRVSDEVAERLREHAAKGSKGITPLLNQAADLLQATPPDVRVGEARLRDGLEKAGEALQEARDGLDLGLGCARDVEGDQNPIPTGERAKIADSYLRRSRLAHAEVLRVLASTQPSDGRVRVELTEDDTERLGSIAGELEHAPVEIRRHFDQDGRDARFLRLLQKRIDAWCDHEDRRK